jgi:hypothetical protein
VDLERIAVRLRPRNSWEALDLGLALGRTRLKPVYAAWFAVYLPAALIAFAIFPDTPFWAWLALWWLKPLFDRVVLEVLARAMFGETVRVKDILWSLPRVAWRSSIIGALTWRRFDFARSLHLPVYQLERLSGKAARARVRLLDRDGRPAAVWLTFMLANVEMLLALSASLTAAFLLPVQAPLETLADAWTRGQLNADSGARLGAALAMLAVCAVEPFYVACGFTLYLQRRTLLEGWDIELRFRNLAARIEAARAAASPAIAALAGVVMMAVAAALAPASEARAADPPREAAQEIRQVLADPQFGRHETVRRIKYVGPEWKAKESGSSLDFNWKWLANLMKLLAESVRVLAWIAGALLLAFALYHLARYLRLHGFLPRKRAQRPDFLFGLDVRPESLPRDVSAAAEALARQGRAREALSLLYRGALVRFMDEGIEFLQGDTEGDCMRRVDAGIASDRRAYFHRLVAAWQTLAYGHRPLAAGVLATLAREWRSTFSDAPDEPAPASALPAAS